MSDFENGNGNSTLRSVNVTPSADAIPITEAARSLAVTLPRLQRALKRQEFASHVWQEARPTRTGTRTVTVVSISVLDRLKAVLREGSGEHKRERSHGEALVSDSAEGERLRAVWELAMRQADARIREQAETITDLRQDKERLIKEHERERSRAEALVLEVQDLRALAAPPDSEKLAKVGDATRGTVGDIFPSVAVPAPVDAPGDESGGETLKGASEGESGQYGAPKKRGLWERLAGFLKDS